MVDALRLAGRLSSDISTPMDSEGKNSLLARIASLVDPSTRVFVAVAFGFSWLVWLPLVLASKGLISVRLPRIPMMVIGAFGPFVAAFGLTYRNEGMKGVITLLRRGVKVRIGWAAALVILLPFVINLLAQAAHVYMDKGRFQLPSVQGLWKIPVVFVAMLFIGGSLQEEFGWRGYVLDRLLRRSGGVFSSFVLGIIWGVWHLPLFYIAGSSQSYMPLWAFMVGIQAYSMLFTWLHNSSRGSIFAAFLLHTSMNTAHNIVPTLAARDGGDQRAFLYMVVLYVAVASVLVGIGGLSSQSGDSHPTRARDHIS